MSTFEMYARMDDGRRRLVATIDGATDTITRVTNAQPVTMQAPQRPTSPQPKAPRLTTMAEARKAVLALLTQDVPPPPPPPLDAIVAKQRELGLR